MNLVLPLSLRPRRLAAVVITTLAGSAGCVVVDDDPSQDTDTDTDTSADTAQTAETGQTDSGPTDTGLAETGTDTGLAETGTDTGLAETGTDTGTSQCSIELEEVECEQPITTDLVLDGQVMTCPSDARVEARLTLRNGSRLELGARLFVGSGGALVTEGTADCPIRLTSSQDSPAAGDWRYIQIDADADNASMLTHTIVEYGGEGSMLFNRGTIGFDNVTIQHVAGTGLDLIDGSVSMFRAVSFNDIPDVAMEISADHAAVIEPDIVIDQDTVQEPFVDVRPQNVTMTIDGTWEDIGVPYRLFGNLNFQAELILEEGADVWIAPAQRFFVEDGGSIKAMGTADNPVTIRSANETGAPGDWNVIEFRSTAANDSLFQHTTIAHGSANSRGALEVDSGATVTLDTVTFMDNLACDITDNGTVDTTDTTYVSCL